MALSSGLPDFERPPLVEVALSVQFEPLSLQTKHLALLWEMCREYFPEWQDQPPIAPSFESLEPGPFGFAAVSPVRAVFRNASATELKQYQGDRFVRNWTKSESAPDYPRYHSIRAPFAGDFEELMSFARENDLGRVIPNQCELTYVNLIPLALGRNEALSQILHPWAGTYSDAFLRAPEAMDLALHFPVTKRGDEPVGRLHVHASVVTHRGTQEKSVQLTLTTRGQPFSADVNGVLEFLDLGREHIVKGFASITTPQMHQFWGRRDGNR